MPDNDLLIDEIETDNGSKIGHIILNSPETLNSLTLAMVEGISKQLEDWEKKNSLKAVLIEGAGEKAFCAGGDIRALYDSMIESPKKSMYAEEFFEKEYRLDYQIHKYPKPVISILDGIVMGGGAGLMLGSHYRISTERTRFAMPEIGVGLFPDVGFSDGKSLVAALALGGEAIVMGTRFMATKEAGVHQNVKDKMTEADELSTNLMFRTMHNTARVFKNSVSNEVVEIESTGKATFEDVKDLVAGQRGRVVFEEGDLEHGIWSAGISVARVKDIPTCEEMVSRLVTDAKNIIDDRLQSVKAS